MLTRLFQHHVLEMLTSQRRLSRDFADRLRRRQPSGFQVYSGRYSNASRGKRRPPSLPPPGTTAVDSSPQTDSPAERFARQRRRNRARLLKKIYEVDPLTCPRCGTQMEIIAFIEEWSVIRKILQHLGLWERPRRAPPPRLPPHKPEAFPATLSPRQAQQFKASTDAAVRDDVPVYRG